MGFPRLPGSYLVVELTNRCSLACVHCSVADEGHPHHAQTGFIDPALVMRLFEDLERSGAGFDTLIPFWLGEPLLHPHFAAIYQAALRLRGVFNKVEVHTNGTHLTPRRVQAALNNGDTPQVWHFSLDAATQETYRTVKARDRFEKVETNIAHFIAEKGRLQARWPRPVFQFIVGSNNVDEVPAFRERWTKVCEDAGVPVIAAAQHVPPGDEAVVFFRQLDCPTADEQARQNQVFRDAMAREGLALPRDDRSPTEVKAENLTPCSGFWKSPVVSWKGEVTVCTRDNLLQNTPGTLGERSFTELWYGALMQERRQRVSEGDYQGLDVCSSCFIPRSSNHADLTDRDIQALRATG